MKKRIISITIFLFLIFFIYNVKASVRYTATSVNTNYETYKNAMNEMANLKCDDTLYNQVTVDKCNSLALKKSTSLSHLFNAKNNDESLINDEINKVLEDNSTECNTVFSTEIQDILKKAFLLFYIAGPILLMLYGSLDMINAIIAGDEKKRKSLFTRFVKRCIALVLLFASPVIVSLIVHLFGADKYTANVYSCIYEGKKVTISYTPVISKKKGKDSEEKASSGAAEGIIKGAEELKKVTSDKKWTYACKGATTVLKNYRNNVTSTVCCADGVAAALVLGGVYDEETIANTKKLTLGKCGTYGGNNESATGLQAFLITQGWIRIENPSDLEPGDVVFFNPQTDTNFECIEKEGTRRAGHVEIYAGDGKTYNWGGNTSIQSAGAQNRVFPTSGKNSFIAGYRAPEGLEK